MGELLEKDDQGVQEVSLGLTWGFSRWVLGTKGV